MKPMIFTTESVRGILDERKNQTRRVVTPANSYFDGGSVNKTIKAAWKDFDWANAYVDPGPSPAGNVGPYLKVPYPKEDTVHRIYPRYAVGDKLWVKETWARTMATAYRQSPGVVFTPNPEDTTVGAVYKAGWTRVKPGPWKPSRFMPKWASRITLEIKNIRVEKIQSISSTDAIAEGVDIDTENFYEFWDSINLKRGYGYDVNPWVFALTFSEIKNHD